MKTDEIKFWEDLSVPVEDIREMINASVRPTTKLLNRLNKYSGWLEILNAHYDTSYSELKLIIRHLATHRKAEFARLFCLIIFALQVDRISIKNRIPNDILEKYKTKLEDNSVSYESILFLLLKNKPQTLKGVFYDSIINRSPTRTFICEPTIDVTEKLQNVSENDIQEFFKKLREDGIIRREVKLWWFETNNSKTKIFVRLESRNRNPIHQVAKNLFLKTAGIKGMVLSEKGNRLDIVSSRDTQAVTKWMELLIEHISKKSVTFSRIVQEFETSEISDFLTRLKNGEIAEMRLLGIERRNAPVVNSPTIRLESSNMEPITESLKELESSHNLNLISEMKDILGITVGIGDITYRLNTLTNKDEKIILNFENRNMSEDKKDAVISTLITAIRK